jgi:hypothetical protein
VYIGEKNRIPNKEPWKNIATEKGSDHSHLISLQFHDLASPRQVHHDCNLAVLFASEAKLI